MTGLAVLLAPADKIPSQLFGVVADLVPGENKGKFAIKIGSLTIECVGCAKAA